MKDILEYRNYLIKLIEQMKSEGHNEYDLKFLKHRLKQIDDELDNYINR